nr:hypothetical protein [uncultured Oscillibacter sp.]
MAEVARLVGMELRKYEKDGQTKQFCGLHLVHLENEEDEEMLGSRVQEISCPRSVSPDTLEVGHLYELNYEHFKMKGQLMARISGLKPVEG